MKDTELETILVKFANRVLDVRNGKDNPTLGELVNEPKQAILSHYIAKSDVETDIIGEDDIPENTIPPKYRDIKKFAKNQLRAEQRQRLKLRGGK